jgi:hypothetical protein
MMVSRPKVSFDKGNTSPGNYGWIFYFVLQPQDLFWVLVDIKPQLYSHALAIYVLIIKIKIYLVRQENSYYLRVGTCNKSTVTREK